MTTSQYDQSNETEIADLLVGHRIVEAEKGSFDYPGRNDWDDHAEGRMVLDDGTELYLVGNVGGCSCSAGDYPLADIAAVDNIITSARVECAPDSDDYGSDWLSSLGPMGTATTAQGSRSTSFGRHD